jgi:hypothetical protein
LFIKAIFEKPSQPPCVALSGTLIFDILEDLLTTGINAKNVDINNKPTITVVAMVDGGNHLLVMGT